VKYDPEIAPDATRWLDADEEERLLAIRRYHERSAENLGEGAKAHFVIHNTVENQLAEGHPAATARSSDSGPRGSIDMMRFTPSGPYSRRKSSSS
jgi:hypothetical protein